METPVDWIGKPGMRISIRAPELGRSRKAVLSEIPPSRLSPLTSCPPANFSKVTVSTPLFRHQLTFDYLVIRKILSVLL